MFIGNAVLKSGRVLFEVEASYSIISALGYIQRVGGCALMHVPDLIQLVYANEHEHTYSGVAGLLTPGNFNI